MSTIPPTGSGEALTTSPRCDRSPRPGDGSGEGVSGEARRRGRAASGAGGPRRGGDRNAGDSRYLDYYADGARYDAEYVHIREDIAYYQQIAADTPGRILELACGTGRLSIPMAQVGAEVHGIDIAPGMLSRAEEKRLSLPPYDQDRLRFDRGDMRTFRGATPYAAVVLAFNTLMHMVRDDDLLATLRTARRNLGPGGLFHLDLHTPYPELWSGRDPEGRYDPQQMIDPRTGDRYVVSENNRYDPRHQINRMSFFYQRVDSQGDPVGPEREAVLELRVLFPRELDFFLKVAGFEVVGDWDDFGRMYSFSGTAGRRVLTVCPRSRDENQGTPDVV